MSITLGIYDLFAYIIPGFLYLFVINEFFEHIGARHIEYSHLANLQTSSALILLTVLTAIAHLLGHLLDRTARWLVLSFPKHKRHPEMALNHIKERYPTLDLQFGSKDWELLFTLLRQRNMEHARLIDTFQANSIMFRNIFLGLVLFVISKAYSLISAYDSFTLIILLGALVLSGLAYQRSRMFHLWFFTDIIEASLDYGTNLDDVVAYRRAETSKSVRKTATRRKA